MDEFSGYVYSWSGFIDYIRCFHVVKPVWKIAGSLIWLGTALSLLPQLLRIVQNRSSYGISPMFVVLTSVSQFLVVMNMFCLHNADFVGANQISMSRVIPRFLTFFNLFTLWYGYFPVIILLYVFFDMQPRVKRTREKFGIEKKEILLISVGFPIFCVFLYTFFHAMSTKHGYGSQFILGLGKSCGGIASILALIHYIPQFVRTYNLKDHGSFSLLMLGIQAPGGLTNAMVMWIGQGEHWTTFTPMMLSAIQQFLLLGMCLYYKHIRNSNLNNHLLSDKIEPIRFTDV